MDLEGDIAETFREYAINGFISRFDLKLAVLALSGEKITKVQLPSPSSICCSKLFFVCLERSTS